MGGAADIRKHGEAENRRALYEFEQTPQEFLNHFVLPSLQHNVLKELVDEIALPVLSPRPVDLALAEA